MAYDIFTPQTGPNIDINLFPQSANAGINGGNAVPTQLAAGITGALKGIQTGQQIATAQQQIEINENTIEQLPTTNAIRQEQLRQAQQENDATAIKLSEKKTADEVLGQLAEKLSSSDPSTALSVLQDKEVQKLALTNKEFATKLYGSLDPYLTPEQRQAAVKQIDYLKGLDYQLEKEKLNATLQKHLLGDSEKALEKFRDNPAFADIIADNPTNFSDVAQRLKVLPKGSFQIDADGRIMKNTEQTVKQQSDNPENLYWIVDGDKVIKTVSHKSASDLLGVQRTSVGSLNASHDAIYGRDARLQKKATDSVNQAPQSTATPITGGLDQADPTATATPTATPTQLYTPIPGGASLDNLVKRKQEVFVQKTITATPGVANFVSQAQTNAAATATAMPTVPATPTGTATATQTATASPTATSTATSTPTYALTPEPPVPTPTQALTAAVGAPAKLSFPPPLAVVTPKFDKIVYSVKNNPLTMNLGALGQGVAAIESAGNPNALSPTGVRGLMQVTKATAAQYGLNRDIPSENVAAGLFYLADQMVTFGNNIPLSLAAYNAGPGYIKEAIRHTGSTDWNVIKGYLKTVLSPQKYLETSTYPDKVIAASVRMMSPDDKAYASLLASNGLITT